MCEMSSIIDIKMYSAARDEFQMKFFQTLFGYDYNASILCLLSYMIEFAPEQCSSNHFWMWRKCVRERERENSIRLVLFRSVPVHALHKIDSLLRSEEDQNFRISV